MTPRSCAHPRFLVLVAMCMAGLSTGVSAQTPPRPAVDIRQLPDLFHNVLPADFNGDGRTDLIAGAASPSGPSTFDRVVVRLGNGNGTFAAPLASTWTGMPVTTGDFNTDGRIDAVVLGVGGAMAILVGRGDGTFTRASELDSVSEFAFAISGDVDGDGWRDLVIGAGNTVEVQPGGNDFTFGPVVTLPATTHGPRAGVLADFNGDGRRDLAVAQRFGSIVIYLNRAAGGWQATEIAIADEEMYGIAAADLNGDARQDLIVTHTIDDYPAWSEGGVEVLLGNGNGTFAPPVRYRTGLPGPVTVAAGDFNRDGLRDVAVGSLSWNWDEESSAYWDSVSIFPGRGNGTLAPAAPFRLDTVARHFANPYMDKHHALKTADFNGDGRLDLVASPGAVILNRAPAANRLPTVDAGPDLVLVQGDARTLRVNIAEPDWDWLRVEWRDELGRWISDSPTAYYIGPYDGGNGSVIVTVTDIRGGVATDRIEVQTAPGDLALYDPAEGNSFSPGSDITVRWSSNLNPREGFRVSASPDDGRTWNVIPECELVVEMSCVWRNAGPAGDTWRLKVEVVSSDVTGEAVSGRFRIGVPSPTDLRVEIVEPESGDRFASGASISIVWRAEGDSPLGHHYRVSVSPDDFVSSRILHGEVPQGESEFIWVNAGPPGTTWRARIEAIGSDGRVIASDTSGTFIIDEALPGAFPWPWEESFDIGAVAAPGSASYANGTFTVRGSGADIWGTADEFHQVLTRWEGDFSLTARVASVENVHQWTKVGLMIRHEATAGSRHASIFVTPTEVKGIAFQRRTVQGGATVNTSVAGLTAPIWLKLARTGNTIRAYYRKNLSDAWTLLGSHNFTSLPRQLEPMLVVSSHVDGRLATGTFDNVVVDAIEPMQSADIGATVPGATVTDGVTTTIDGNGADIWGRADAFRFHYTRWAGNGTITARVWGLENTHAWAKAGVMFRESLAAGSKHVMAIVSAGKGMAVQYRSLTGGSSASTPLRAGTAPEWIRLNRSGNTFTAHTSNDGVTWNMLGTATVSMAAEILVGLPVTSHSAGTLATAVFDDVSVQR